MSTQGTFEYRPSTYARWEQNPEYVEACRVIPRLGDPMAYTPAHPAGYSPPDVTSFKVGMAGWNEHNLPNIMYQLWPCKSWRDFKDSAKPPQKLDAQGNPVFEQYPRPGEDARPVLDFPILQGIDKISTEVPWWFIEILFRLEPRLKWEDIDMLMENVGSKVRQPRKSSFINGLNMGCVRKRAIWSMVSWREKSKQEGPNKTRDEVIQRLSPAQYASNTTSGTTPGSLDEFGNLIPVPTRGHPGTQQKRSKKSKGKTPQRSSNVNLGTSSAGPSHPPRIAVSSPDIILASSAEGDSDDDDDDDDGLDAILSPSPRSQRKRKAVDYDDEEGEEDSADSQFEPTPGPSRVRRDSSDGKTIQRPDPEPQRQQNKKRKVQADSPSHCALEDHSLMQPPSRLMQPPSRHMPSQDNIFNQSNIHRLPQHVEQIRKNRTQRPASHATSTSLRNEVFSSTLRPLKGSELGQPLFKNNTGQSLQSGHQTSHIASSDLSGNAGSGLPFRGAAEATEQTRTKAASRVSPDTGSSQGEKAAVEVSRNRPVTSNSSQRVTSRPMKTNGQNRATVAKGQQTRVRRPISQRYKIHKQERTPVPSPPTTGEEMQTPFLSLPPRGEKKPRRHFKTFVNPYMGYTNEMKREINDLAAEQSSQTISQGNPAPPAAAAQIAAHNGTFFANLLNSQQARQQAQTHAPNTDIAAQHRSLDLHGEPFTAEAYARSQAGIFPVLSHRDNEPSVWGMEVPSSWQPAWDELFEAQNPGPALKALPRR